MPTKKVLQRLKVKRRTRKRIWGTAEKPRLSVFRSNKQIYGQLINDDLGVTILAASSRDEGLASDATNKVDQANKVGKALGEKAVANGVDTIIFDRNGSLYHGRVKSFAEGAREAGLKF
jgi:large subunit ribosomal protein L18